jgi:WD40 repeat protein
VTIWDGNSGQALRTVDAHNGGITEIIFSQDGAYLVTTSIDTTAKVWDFRAITGGSANQELLTLTGHSALVANTRFSPDQTLLATSAGDGIVKIWFLESNSKGMLSGREWLTLAGHKGPIFGLDFSPDGQTLGTASIDGTVRVWDLSPVRELLTLVGDADLVRSVIAFNPNGTRLAVASRSGAKVWDVDTSLAAASGRSLFNLSTAGEMTEVNDIAFNPAGSRLVTANSNNTATVWDADTGKELFTVGGPAPRRSNLELSGVIAVAFSPDGKRLATASHDGTAKIWDMATQQEFLTLTGHPENVTGKPFEGALDVAFSPLLDDQKILLATAGTDGTAKIWDSYSGELLLTVSIGKLIVRGVAFNPTGTQLVTAGEDGAVNVWDISEVLNKDAAATLDTGTKSIRPIHTFPAALGDAWDTSFSPDGSFVVGGGDNGIVKVWDATTNQELLTLTGPGANSVAFTPDSKRLAVARDDGTVHFYVLPIEELVDLAQSRVTRSLTTEECQQFLHVDECPASP